MGARVPAAAAGLADVVAADLHPLVLGRRRQHFVQKLAVAGLDDRPLTQIEARLGYAVGELVTDPLEAAEVEDPRLRGDRPQPVLDLDPAECLADQTAELALEGADLTAQLGPSKALVDRDAGRRLVFSCDQIQHRPASSLPRIPSLSQTSG